MHQKLIAMYSCINGLFRSIYLYINIIIPYIRGVCTYIYIACAGINCDVFVESAPLECIETTRYEL